MIIRALCVIGLAAVLAAPYSHNHELCEGFAPENDLWIPESADSTANSTEAEFNATLDVVQAHYTPIIAALGGELRVNRNWADGWVNASASRNGNVYNINMYGGLARHPEMTTDGFMLVACHEIGHHIGGSPKSYGWATNEGGADYWATLRCLRAVWTDEDNLKFVNENTIDPYLKERCETTWNTQSEENFCIRSSMAGMSGAMFFYSLRENIAVPHYSTPDPAVVNRTVNSHPQPQCRLDTYFQGALCVHDTTIGMSDTDPTVGTCNETTGQAGGFRPKCWFKPPTL